MQDKRPRVNFPVAKDMGERIWGKEKLLVHAEKKYTMKKLFIKRGQKGGLQYHRLKDEAAFVLSGQILLRFEAEDGSLEQREFGPGDFFHFPPGSVHQEEALPDVVLIEVSTSHFNDRVRVEKEFGLDPGDGLPTTTLDEILSG